MTTNHSLLAGADLHQIKGAAAAEIGAYLVNDGAGSSVWQKMPRADIIPIWAGVTLTTPTVYTVAAAACLGSVLTYKATVNALTSAVTYTDTVSRICHVDWSVTLSHNDASARDVYASLALNGVAQSNYEIANSLVQNAKGVFHQSLLITLAEDDVLTVMVKCSNGNVTHYAPSIVMTGTEA